MVLGWQIQRETEDEEDGQDLRVSYLRVPTDLRTYGTTRICFGEGVII